MSILKLPPKIKVLEALGAVADGRIEVLDEKRARVISSDGSRVYTVYVDIVRGEVYSDDNGTRYRGYIGYPIIAFLMIKGVVPFDEKLAKAFKGIPWRELNERYKSYSTVESIVRGIARKQGVNDKSIDIFIDTVMKSLSKLKLIYKHEHQLQ